MKKRRLEDDNSTTALGPKAETPTVTGRSPRPDPSPEMISSGKPPIAKEIVAGTGLHIYRYRLSGFPPTLAEQERIQRFLGVLIPKLMVFTGTRLEPYVFLDGRFINDELFNHLRQGGVAWRGLLGVPVIPGLHPFRYLPIAFHIQNRNAWNEVANDFLGTGGIAIYLTARPAENFFTYMQQTMFTRNERGQTQILPLYLPEVTLSTLKNAAAPRLKSFFEYFQFFVGENEVESLLEILSLMNIDDVVSAALER